MINGFTLVSHSYWPLAHLEQKMYSRPAKWVTIQTLFPFPLVHSLLFSRNPHLNGHKLRSLMTLQMNHRWHLFTLSPFPFPSALSVIVVLQVCILYSGRWPFSNCIRSSLLSFPSLVILYPPFLLHRSTLRDDTWRFRQQLQTRIYREKGEWTMLASQLINYSKRRVSETKKGIDE